MTCSRYALPIVNRLAPISESLREISNSEGGQQDKTAAAILTATDTPDTQHW
ncbi:MAG: hypothetical protein ABSG03_39515 [Bryobacteraceae bacterium]|jgi:hypothetical protein